jgi:hypothetical protein
MLFMFMQYEWIDVIWINCNWKDKVGVALQLHTVKQNYTTDWEKVQCFTTTGSAIILEKEDFCSQTIQDHVCTSTQ